MIKHVFSVMITVCCSCLLLISKANAEFNSYNNGFQKERLTEYLNTLEDQGVAMVTVSISHKGEVIYDKQTGFAQIETALFSEDRKLPATDNTRYLVASVTKMFTSVLIHQLIEEGKLSYQTKLSDFYPEIANAKKITIEHLLEHSSGLLNYTGNRQPSPVIYEDHSKQGMLDLFATYLPQFEPGSEHQYSNTGYILLGFILEDITEKPYENLVQQRISKAIGLENTYYCRNRNECGPNSKSYNILNGKWRPEKELGKLKMFSAAGLQSTSKDMVLFMDALFSHKLIKKQSLDNMIESDYPMTFDEDWGKGIFPTHFSNHIGYFHNGFIEAYESWSGHFPDEEVSIAISSNALYMNFEDLVDNILGFYFDTPLNIPDTTRPVGYIKEQYMDRYVGKYISHDTPITVSIYVKNGKLMFETSESSPSKMYAYNLTEFENRHLGYRLDFQDLKSRTEQYSSFVLRFGTFKTIYYRQ